jgi:hypothetical protein
MRYSDPRDIKKGNIRPTLIFVGPCAHRDRDYPMKFYLIRTDFTLSELVSLVKVFRLFRSKQIFRVFRVWTQ